MPNLYEKMVLSVDSPFLKYFSFIITLLALISTFMCTYMACFGFPDNKNFFAVYYTLEALFGFDIILHFFSEHLDDDFKPVREFKPIFMRYMKNGFFFDFIATFPIHLFMLEQFENEDITEQLQCIFLLKMFRFFKVGRLFETKNFQDFIKDQFKQRLQKTI